MCKYCKVNKDGEGFNLLGKTGFKGLKNSFANLNLADGKKFILAFCFGGEYSEKTIQINYCPMCGRRLSDDKI